jgi:Rrf2 family protein
LLQILRHLVTHGILHSTRGVDGGYSLDRSPDEISLLEVIEAIDGPLGPLLPESELPRVAENQLRLREALEMAAANLRRQLQSIKIADLLGTSSLAKLA